jgi:hypothetical protein
MTAARAIIQRGDDAGPWTVQLPLRLENPLNGSGRHWRVRAKKRAAIRHPVQLAVCGVVPYDVRCNPLIRLIVTVTRIGAGKMNAWDGLPAACKPVIDGVADACDEQDESDRFTWRHAQRSMGRGVFGVEIRIERA